MLKPVIVCEREMFSLITVQDNTMLKLHFRYLPAILRLITVQDNTMLKPCIPRGRTAISLITVQDNTMLKQKLY